jgi:hypothetical protein
LNPKTINNIEQLKSKLNTLIPLTTGSIRKIVTIFGKEIASLEDLEPEHSYIAVGGEGKIKEVPLALQTRTHTVVSVTPLPHPSSTSTTPSPSTTTSRASSPIKSSPTKKAVVQNKYNGEIFGTQGEKAISITCFRNGDKHHKGEKISVHPKKIKTFDQLIQASNVVRLVTGAVRKIYNLEGKQIKSINELQDGGHYICVGGEKLVPRV